ncbi:hypothetical protein CLAFUW4_07045 [Fulvia fulva]|nr:hypothetical protein CLAFUR4_07054 [Fulvia fulva]WPV16229.1 hypothetical protein CLAFUW4_07045 [Fulvia fulva]WPV30834.1 hypothetical protein CLAFUW7_07045 [Fulvia fulva]
MALSTLSALEGDVVDISAIIDDIDEELEDTHDPLLDTLRVSDLQPVCTAATSLHGCSSLRAKLLAVEKGDVDLLKRLLEINNSIDESLVEAACISKDQACIVALLDSGLPINQPLNPDQYILWTAANDVTFARFLVGVGADVNCRTRYDMTALSAAIAYGSINVVRFLISQGPQHAGNYNNPGMRDEALPRTPSTRNLARPEAKLEPTDQEGPEQGTSKRGINNTSY